MHTCMLRPIVDLLSVFSRGRQCGLTCASRVKRLGTVPLLALLCVVRHTTTHHRGQYGRAPGGGEVYSSPRKGSSRPCWPWDERLSALDMASGFVWPSFGCRLVQCGRCHVALRAPQGLS